MAHVNFEDFLFPFSLFVLCGAHFTTRFQVRYILSEPKQNNWNGEIGRISADIATSLFKSDSQYYSEFCLVCGPLHFNDSCETLLHQAGFDEEKIHLFRG